MTDNQGGAGILACLGNKIGFAPSRRAFDKHRHFGTYCLCEKF
jgi:hypothetical protein